MRITTRADLDIQRFISLANLIGLRSFESMIDRRLYCDLINHSEFPENKIFVLRHATTNELRRLDFPIELNTEDKKASALTELLTLAKTCFPEQISNFRIVRRAECFSEAFLVNEYGETSPTRPLEFFRSKSKATIMKHCLSLGGYVWCGPFKMYEPFYGYCLDIANNDMSAQHQ
jgi:hypothetical protein